MKSPKNLKHKPIISVNDYHKNDGHYSEGTDAKALSIGYSQYDNKEISLKVWRRPNGKWSRQSEELPLHRNIDLNILLLGALMTDINTGFPKTELSVEVDNLKGVQTIKDYYFHHKDQLTPRLIELKKQLDVFLK